MSVAYKQAVRHLSRCALRHQTAVLEVKDRHAPSIPGYLNQLDHFVDVNKMAGTSWSQHCKGRLYETRIDAPQDSQAMRTGRHDDRD